ncbi:hypothetical protein IMZ48_07485 [Candidatus Bathyarchaeota archaeon]|nr:hypothetical protein [Candidatus Bathyarchaeota archaeon]
MLLQAADISDSDSLNVEVESDDDTRRERFFRSPAMTSDWLDGVEPPPEIDLHAGDDLGEIVDAPRSTVEEDASLAQLSAYESFIRTSDAYA